MTNVFNFALKIKGGEREGGTCEVLRPCYPPKENLERAHGEGRFFPPPITQSFQKIWI